MKIVHVIPSRDAKGKLKTLLQKKEISLRGTSTTLFRYKQGRWKHTKYSGWITWEEALGGTLVAEVHSKKDGEESQLLRSFVGYLERHLGMEIDCISIYYR